MNIGSVEGGLAVQAAATQQQIGIAVLSKTMDIAKAQGQAVIDLIEGVAEIADQLQSSNGRHIDVQV